MCRPGCPDHLRDLTGNATDLLTPLVVSLTPDSCTGVSSMARRCCWWNSKVPDTDSVASVRRYVLRMRASFHRPSASSYRPSRRDTGSCPAVDPHALPGEHLRQVIQVRRCHGDGVQVTCHVTDQSDDDDDDDDIVGVMKSSCCCC